MKKWLFALGLILLLGLVAFAFFPKNRFKEQSVVLKDGSVMQFFRADYGTNLTWTEATLWERLKMKLPARFRGFQTASSIQILSGTPSLVLWSRWQSKTPNSREPHFCLEDENGICSSVSYVSYNERTFLGGTNAFGGFNFTSFPRRGKTFTLHFFEYDSSWNEAKTASIKLDNPAWGSAFTELKPEPLPATKADGDLQATLTRLIANTSAEDGQAKPVRAEKFDAGTYIALKMVQNNKPATNWGLCQVTFSDATGNWHENTMRSDWNINGENISLTSSYLWPDEPAWKLKLELSRNSGFTPDELVSFTNVAVVASRWSTNVVQRGQAGAYQIEMLEPTGTGPEQPEGRHRTYLVRFKTMPNLDGCRFTVTTAKDERGNSLQPMGWGASGNNEFNVSLGATNATKFLNLTLAIHKSRFFEFTVKPEVLKKEPVRSDAR